MKLLILCIFLTSLGALATSEPPQGYPLVKGVIRKVDLPNMSVTIKHDRIPNLGMPGMTMTFMAKEPDLLKDISPNDKVQFASDEINGDLTLLWIKKADNTTVDSTDIVCTGEGGTSPTTDVEITIRDQKFSTIRYEINSGSWAGTSWVNSIGRLNYSTAEGSFTYKNGDGPNATNLTYNIENKLIKNAKFSNYSASMYEYPVNCTYSVF